MKELKVHQTSDLLAFSYNTQENLERSDVGTLVGCIGANGELAYLARGKSIEVVKTFDGNRRSACNLGAIRDNVNINCITEFFVGDSKKLLLGLEVFGWKRSGMLCVYDFSLSRIIRAIWLPQAVNAITTIKDLTEFESNLSFFSNEKSKSIAIVGCKGGQILVIKFAEMNAYDQQNDLSLPAELEYIKVNKIPKLDGSRLQASVNYCIDLSVDFFSDGSFRYMDPAGKTLKVFKKRDVAISSLLLVKQASLLIAGYTFGCFQIWDLQTLQPIFSSSYSPSLAGVSHLTFQEPENDPRFCCYLLVGRSPQASSDMNEATTITLYQLVFEIKEPNGTGFSIYRELEAVCKRFEHQLTSDSNHLADLVSIGSRIITCSTLAREIKQQRLEQSIGSTNDFDGKHTDTTLAYVVWESPPQDPERSHPSYHLGLFDMNRWYQLQMPSSVSSAMYGSSDPVCPFFAFYSLGEVSEAIIPDILVDCHINAKDISCFSNPVYPTLEQNFWPSALAFKCTCLAESGIVKTEMLGMQRQILADLVSKGNEIFNRGYHLINLCWSAGLIPKLEVSRLDDPKIQFECLMSVAIEHNLMAFIISCIRDWSLGEITNAGSCLKSVLQWTWKRVIKAKGTLDELYIPLFYSETSKLDDDVIRSLSHCVDELKGLLQILKALDDCPVAITDEGISSLSTKITVTNCIHRYADVILFFVRSKMLPESTESKQINFKSPFDDDSLFIDEHCKVIQQKIQENDDHDDFGWDGQYPPPSVNVVCKSLLLDIPRDDLINFLYYWILDAEEFLQIEKFAEKASYHFNISTTKKNVIEATWDLDHNHLENGVEKLMEFGPELLPNAMKAVYRFGKRSLACGIYKAKEMLTSGDTDWKMCIKILVENMAVFEAYKLQAKYRSSDLGFELFQYFLEQCFKNNAMPKLFDLHLTNEDEDWLYQFLENNNNSVSKELLVVFCIKRHRYAEALRHGANFENQRWTYKDKSLFGDIPSRKAIMHMSDKIILPMQRKLISYQAKYPDYGDKMHPEPLSMMMMRKDFANAPPHSGTISKILFSVKVNRSSSDSDVFEESFNLPFVGNIHTPTGRKRREYGKPSFKTEVTSQESAKKGILKPVVSESIKSDIPSKRRKHLFYGSEAMKLLQTPPVIKNPNHLKLARSLRTPASILKSSKTVNKKEGKEKSVRKKVIISDPNVSISPAQPQESPSNPPDSPSCLETNVFKQEIPLENPTNEIETGQSSEDIKRSLDLEFETKESGTKEPGDTSTNQLQIIAEKHLSDTLLERNEAVVDTTAIKEAEIYVYAENESILLGGYNATEGNVPGKLQNDLTKDETEQEQADKTSNVAEGGQDYLSVGQTALDKVDASIDVPSPDITLDFFDERHGIFQPESFTAPNLASELLQSEEATHDLQAEFEEESAQPEKIKYEVDLTGNEFEAEGEKEAGYQQGVSEDFVLELNVDSNDFEEERALEEEEEEEEVRLQGEIQVEQEVEIGAEKMKNVETKVEILDETGSEAQQKEEPEQRMEDKQEIDIEDLKEESKVEVGAGLEVQQKGEIEQKETGELEKETVGGLSVEIEKEFERKVEEEMSDKNPEEVQNEAKLNDQKSEEVLEVHDGKIKIIDDDVPTFLEEKIKPSKLNLELPTLLKPPIGLTTPSSDISTPDTCLDTADSSSLVRLSDVETPDFIKERNIGGSSGLTLRSHRLTAERPTEGAVEDLVKDGEMGNLKIFVNKTNITNEMRPLDSSFESQESSFVSSPSTFYDQPLEFVDLDKEHEATPPKQAKKAERTTVLTRKQASEKKSQSKPQSPVKSRRSNSSSKSKRTSFHTPKKSPNAPFSYTPPVTRLSAKKNTPIARPLQEIGENALLRSNISESPISFTPRTESGRKKPRDRLKRYSLQSPSVHSTHTMTLRSRTPKAQTSSLAMK